ncbi:MAG: pilus assembly protein [Yoonia sp.]|uniref:pilus assembly protein n=1 Tax=Yoonia sp. TaxID=2212373 RepID=UPI003EF6182E
MPLTLITCAMNHFRAFRNDESGSATVDFVMLTSSIVLMGAAHVKDVADGTINYADDVSACLGTDIADLVVDGDPNDIVANLQLAAAACSSR